MTPRSTPTSSIFTPTPDPTDDNGESDQGGERTDGHTQPPQQYGHSAQPPVQPPAQLSGQPPAHPPAQPPVSQWGGYAANDDSQVCVEYRHVHCMYYIKMSVKIVLVEKAL